MKERRVGGKFIIVFYTQVDKSIIKMLLVLVYYLCSLICAARRDSALGI